MSTCDVEWAHSDQVLCSDLLPSPISFKVGLGNNICILYKGLSYSQKGTEGHRCHCLEGPVAPGTRAAHLDWSVQGEAEIKKKYIH